jgi:hypothetical protein
MTDRNKQILDQIEIITKAVKVILDILPVDNSLDAESQKR